MSKLRRRLAPRIFGALMHPRTRALRYRAGEWHRRLARAPHCVRYFWEAGDPYSHLAAQVLEALLARYAVRLEVYFVSAPDDAVAPARAELEAYARKDAGDIAPHYGLRFPREAVPPSARARENAVRALAAQFAPGTAATPETLRTLVRAGEELWRGDEAKLAARAAAAPPADARAVQQHGAALRQRHGHYLGAMFHYGETPGGEWYWGVDRLWHLERRLQSLGLLRPGAPATPIAPRPKLQTRDEASRSTDRMVAAQNAAPSRGRDEASRSADHMVESRRDSPSRITLEYFPSLRSPYSAIAMRRVFALAERWPVTLRLRPVLPMVMRGLPVPAAKRRYIIFDTKREAEDAGEPFGRICDPVGRPVERAFALYPWACARGRGAQFLAAFTEAAFARGIDTGEDAGLQQVVERAGLSWSDACNYAASSSRQREGESLRDSTMRSAQRDASPRGWREELEENRRALFAHGLWGVPSFRIACANGEPDFCTWGQDRIWLVEAELRRRLGA